MIRTIIAAIVISVMLFMAAVVASPAALITASDQEIFAAYIQPEIEKVYTTPVKNMERKLIHSQIMSVDENHVLFSIGTQFLIRVYEPKTEKIVEGLVYQEIIVLIENGEFHYKAMAPKWVKVRTRMEV